MSAVSLLPVLGSGIFPESADPSGDVLPASCGGCRRPGRACVCAGRDAYLRPLPLSLKIHGVFEQLQPEASGRQTDLGQARASRPCGLLWDPCFFRHFPGNKKKGREGSACAVGPFYGLRRGRSVRPESSGDGDGLSGCGTGGRYFLADGGWHKLSMRRRQQQRF